MSKSFGKTTRLVAEDAEQRAAAASGGDATAGSVATQIVLVMGTATVNTLPVLAGSKVLVTSQSPNASTAIGIPTVGTITPGDPGHIVVYAATPGTPGTPVATDVSTYNVLVLSP